MEIPDTELRERLIAQGYIPPPITGTSRNVLLKKLKSLETGNKMESANNSNSDLSANDEDETNISQVNEGKKDINSDRKIYRRNFLPERIGIYSKSYTGNRDFWDRIGIIGTFIILSFATVLVFYLFKFIGDWSDSRYRSIQMSDAVLPKCSTGGVAGLNCIPDSEMKFTENNINLMRAALHHTTVTERCRRANFQNFDYIGVYPLFKDDDIQKILQNFLNFSLKESELLLQNSKVLFKVNPKWDVKILKDGILYRNLRLLRTCGYLSWNDYVHAYSLYGIASFIAVFLTYKLNRWVNKLRADSEQIRKRVIKDIFDILKQNEKQNSVYDFLTVEQMYEWLSSVDVIRKPRVWENVLNYLKEKKTSISVETRIIQGVECKVFRLAKT